MYNRVILIGRTTADAELQYTKSNKAFARATIAVNRRYKNQNGDYEADFINLVAWGKTAELLSEYTRKGMLISVEGELRSSSYEKDGQRLYRTDVLVSNFTRLEKPKNATDNDSVFGHSEPMDIADDDLPF